MNSRARFSGRQRCGVGTGSDRVLRHEPARYRERFCTPSSRRLVWLSVITLVLALFSSCNKSGSTESQPTTTPQTVPNIRSSADIVKGQAAAISIAAGGNADATVTLSISPGFHVNANPATFPYLIATEVKHTPDPDDCVIVGKPIYPTAIYKKFAFAEKPLAVYEGEVNVKLPISLPKAGKCYVTYMGGSHISLPIDVRVQACDNEQCFPPDTLKTTISVDVK